MENPTLHAPFVARVQGTIRHESGDSRDSQGGREFTALMARHNGENSPPRYADDGEKVLKGSEPADATTVVEDDDGVDRLAIGDTLTSRDDVFPETPAANRIHDGGREAAVILSPHASSLQPQAEAVESAPVDPVPDMARTSPTSGAMVIKDPTVPAPSQIHAYVSATASTGSTTISPENYPESLRTSHSVDASPERSLSAQPRSDASNTTSVIQPTEGATRVTAEAGQLRQALSREPDQAVFDKSGTDLGAAANATPMSAHRLPIPGALPDPSNTTLQHSQITADTASSRAASKRGLAEPLPGMKSPAANPGVNAMAEPVTNGPQAQTPPTVQAAVPSRDGTIPQAAMSGHQPTPIAPTLPATPRPAAVQFPTDIPGQTDARDAESATRFARQTVETVASNPAMATAAAETRAIYSASIQPGALFMPTRIEANRPEIQPSEPALTSSGINPDARFTAPTVGSATASFTSATTPAAVVQQIVQVSGALGRSPIEVSLSPEELGRVRMTLTTTESGMVLSITADRDDTMALLRRHMDLLSNELGSLGLNDLSFRFESDGDRQDNAETGKGGSELLRQDGGDPDTAPIRSDHSTAQRYMAGDRLDLRL